MALPDGLLGGDGESRRVITRLGQGYRTRSSGPSPGETAAASATPVGGHNERTPLRRPQSPVWTTRDPSPRFSQPERAARSHPASMRRWAVLRIQFHEAIVSQGAAGCPGSLKRPGNAVGCGGTDRVPAVSRLASRGLRPRGGLIGSTRPATRRFRPSNSSSPGGLAQDRLQQVSQERARPRDRLLLPSLGTGEPTPL